MYMGVKKINTFYVNNLELYLKVAPLKVLFLEILNFSRRLTWFFFNSKTLINDGDPVTSHSHHVFCEGFVCA